MSVCVLIIDDESHVLASLQRLFRIDDYEVLTASSGEHALDILATRDVGVIVCDQQMPGMHGAEVLRRSLTIRPYAVRILLTGHTDLEAARRAINDGKINSFLTKPWNNEQLRATVREAAHLYETDQNNRMLNEMVCAQRDELARCNRELEGKVLARTAALAAAYEETLNALVIALDAREQAVAGHSRRVTLYSLYLAARMGIPESQFENIYRGAMLHDLGKIGVPDSVLRKPGSLTTEERAVVEQHVSIGVGILTDIVYLRPALPIPQFHHERFDGTGYAGKLAAEEIPLEARVFALIDVYDALRSIRPYKPALPHEEARNIILRESGKHFDPAVVRAFAEVPGSVWDEISSVAPTVSLFREAITIIGQIGLPVSV